MRASGNSNATANVAAVARKQLLLRVGRCCAAMLALALIAAGSRGVYRVWRNQHLEKQAVAFAARGDVQSAVLTARHLLDVDSQNFTAARLMAELAERSGSVDAVEWRKRVVALQPDNAQNQLVLAATALRFGQIDLAARSLNRGEATLGTTPRWLQLTGTVALARHDMAKAQQCFSAALAQEPANHQVALNLATVQLASNDPTAVENARASLRRLIDEPDCRATALRPLAADALAHRDSTNARRWTATLLQEKSPPFADYLLHLEATLGSSDASAALTKSKQAAAGSASLAADLITWMNRHDLAADALSWSKSLDANIVRTQPVPLALAESLSCTRDWPALTHFVQNANWGNCESLRLAVQSHAARHLENSDASADAATLWRGALKAAQGHPDQLAMIAKLAQGWGYTAEAAEVLWQIASGSTGANEALRALQHIYNQSRDTHGLLRVARRALELNPDDLVAANNCASLGLLLNGDANARRIAEKLYNEHPTNAAFAATYAFALHMDGKTADALRVIERLKEKQLRQPALAAYYVVMLAASGNLERARAFLPAAERATLLPEEQTLLADAARKLTAGS